MSLDENKETCSMLTKNGEKCSYKTTYMKVVDGVDTFTHCKFYCSHHIDKVFDDLNKKFDTVSINGEEYKIVSTLVKINDIDINLLDKSVLKNNDNIIIDISVLILTFKKFETDTKYTFKWDGTRWITSTGWNIINNTINLKYAISYIDEYCPKLSNKNLKDFSIIKSVGKGAYGEVYLTYEKQSNIICVLKIIKNLNMKEIEIQSKLCHPNIVKIYGYFQKDNKLYIIQEYISGKDLTCGKYPIDKVKKYIRQLSEVLKYLQSQKIIHKDIKPQNIIINNLDNIKLTDFGLAVYEFDPFKLTGSPNYMSPEILSKTKQSYCNDIWALGVITYCLIGENPPFQTTNRIDTFNAIKNYKYEFTDNFTDELSKDFISKILVPENKRLTIDEVINHPFLIL